MRKADATRLSILIPETFPLKRLLKKLLNMFSIASSHIPKKIADTLGCCYSIDGIADTVHGIACCFGQSADGITDSFHLLPHAVDGV